MIQSTFPRACSVVYDTSLLLIYSTVLIEGVEGQKLAYIYVLRFFYKCATTKEMLAFFFTSSIFKSPSQPVRADDKTADNLYTLFVALFGDLLSLVTLLPCRSRRGEV